MSSLTTKVVIICLCFAVVYQQKTNIIVDFGEADEGEFTNDIQNYTNIRTCSCDSWNNICENFCCCDTDCSQTIRDTWIENDVCTNKTLEDYYLLCPSGDNYDKILSALTDPKKHDAVQIPQESTYLCVYYDDIAPYKGYFFTEIRLEQQDSSLEKNFLTQDLSRKDDIANQPINTAYSEGDKIWSQRTIPDYTNPFSIRGFTIPRADPYGYCEESYSAKYLENFDYQTCLRTVDFDDACDEDTFLGRNYYSSAVNIYPNQNDETNLVSISRRNVLLTRGSLDANPTLDNSGAACTCRNLVRFVKYFIVHDNEGQITDVNVDLILENVENSVCSNEIAIEQGFAVEFVSDASAIPRSGNPGYINGYPLLLGITNNSPANTISRPIEGFWMKGVNLDRTCRTGASLPEVSGSYFPESIINFGSNSTFSCHVTLEDEDDFINACTSASVQQILLFKNFNQAVQVGRFGSSNIHYITDWVLLETNQALSQVATTLSDLVCVQPMIEELTFFYSRYGLESSPQYYIVKALRTFATDTYTFDSSRTTNQLTYQQRIRFIEVDSDNI